MESRRRRERCFEERIDCSICPIVKDCEGCDYCRLAVIGPKDEFPPPSIYEISKDHAIKKSLIFIKPVSGCNLDNFDLPV
ncbi:MAG: hypothetical protein V3574_00880 [Candidatus Moraniibacteriota bacterium]